MWRGERIARIQVRRSAYVRLGFSFLLGRTSVCSPPPPRAQRSSSRLVLLSVFFLSSSVLFFSWPASSDASPKPSRPPVRAWSPRPGASFFVYPASGFLAERSAQVDSPPRRTVSRGSPTPHRPETLCLGKRPRCPRPRTTARRCCPRSPTRRSLSHLVESETGRSDPDSLVSFVSITLYSQIPLDRTRISHVCRDRSTLLRTNVAARKKFCARSISRVRAAFHRRHCFTVISRECIPDRAAMSFESRLALVLGDRQR